MTEVEIINIGDELLIGQVVNTNAADMAKMLNKAGFDVRKTSVIGDEAEIIRSSLQSAMQRAAVVLITGGLGPTKDDITKKVLAEEFDSSLIMNEQVRVHVERYFASKGLPFTPTNAEQALVPDKCRVVFNSVGTAPGMCFEKNGKLVFSMPGVPFEMRTMMPEVIEIMKQHFKSEAVEYKTLLVSGIGESFLSDKLEGFEANLPRGISLAYLPKGGTIRLRLTAKGADKNKVADMLDRQTELLLASVKDYFMGFECDNLAETLGERLSENGKTVATAESCTGGNIAHLITLVAGSSRYYKGSVVSYANEVKEKVLGVRAGDLQQYGAVSEEVVKQMAEGVKRLLKTDYAIATSGIAGPSGGSDEKPVGTVWIAVAGERGCVAEKFLFNTTRDNFIERTSNQAILMLLHQMR